MHVKPTKDSPRLGCPSNPYDGAIATLTGVVALRILQKIAGSEVPGGGGGGGLRAPWPLGVFRNWNTGTPRRTLFPAQLKEPCLGAAGHSLRCRQRSPPDHPAMVRCPRGATRIGLRVPPPRGGMGRWRGASGRSGSSPTPTLGGHQSWKRGAGGRGHMRASWGAGTMRGCRTPGNVRAHGSTLPAAGVPPNNHTRGSL